MTNWATDTQDEAADLPEGWAVIPLGQLLDQSRMARPRQTEDHAVPFIPMSLISETSLEVPGFELRTLEAVRSGVVVREGDVLLAKITPCLENGKQGIVPHLPRAWGYATTEVFPLRPKPELDREFLALYLKQSNVRRSLADKMEGTTGRQRLPKVVVDRLPIPLPPLAEQRTIARVLRTVQRAREATEAVIAATRTLKQSLMRHLFTYGPVPVGEADRMVLKETEIGTMPEDWEMTHLGELATVTSGGTPDRSQPSYWSGSIPWVKTGEINYNVIMQTSERISDEGIRNSAARIVPAGTLLMAMYGQGATRGRVAVLGINAALNQACAAISPNSEGILTTYLFHYCTHGYEEIRSLARGANQQNLNAGIIRSILAPVPSRMEQESIVSILAAADQKLTAAESQKAALHTLFKTLLDNLMTGRLLVAEVEDTVLAEAAT
ncbi:MAG: restriction endonuclease subunit S [Dehalococcoidia bacterium]